MMTLLWLFIYNLKIPFMLLTVATIACCYLAHKKAEGVQDRTKFSEMKHTMYPQKGGLGPPLRPMSEVHGLTRLYAMMRGYTWKDAEEYHIGLKSGVKLSEMDVYMEGKGINRNVTSTAG